MLAQAIAPKFPVLYAFLLSAAFVHFRGRVPHPFSLKPLIAGSLPYATYG